LVQESGARPARLLERSVGRERSYRDLLAKVPEEDFEAPRADTGLEAVERVAIGIGGDRDRSLPCHTTRHAGPHRAVRGVEVWPRVPQLTARAAGFVADRARRGFTAPFPDPPR
jgi:hypothetical protein